MGTQAIRNADGSTTWKSHDPNHASNKAPESSNVRADDFAEPAKAPKARKTRKARKG